MNPADAPVVIVPVANPVQAECLERIFTITPPQNRLVVAAAYLSSREHPVLVADIFRAAGFSLSSFTHYTSRCHRKRYNYVDGMVYLRLADALRVPVLSLIGDGGELLPDPSVVLQLPVSVRAMSGSWLTQDDLDARVRRLNAAKQQRKRAEANVATVGDNVIPLRAQRRA